ncbi:Receptor expression-enhancing protein 3 [Takifugu flavidus]|uniref:Receptor expression-enhancing protein n=2 Tax=Tetraodontidae TaxID=31031 RepID=A0A5C6PPI3_9TELE|nr:Receptor expression-enhancing protein 3 [Takifugu flavidus]
MDVGPATIRSLSSRSPRPGSRPGSRVRPRLVFGTLYPAYYSYKAVKTKNVKEYVSTSYLADLPGFHSIQVRWMMYWIVFALYTVAETITDLTLSWFPLYCELKIAVVIWLLSPYTRGASLIYRKCLHPLLSSKEREIDEYIVQAKERSYETMVSFGKQGLSIAATAAVSAAVKASFEKLFCTTYILQGQGAITEKLRSLSMHDLTQINQQDDRGGNQFFHFSSHSASPAVRRSQNADSAAEDEYFYDNGERTDEDADPTFSEDEALTQRGLRRSQSVKITRSRVRKDARYGSLKIKGKKRSALSSVNYGM